MPEEESSLLLIKNPPSRVTIQLEEESDKKKGRIWRERWQGKNRETNGDSAGREWK